MTLDEEISKKEDELAHFIETEQWLPAVQAMEFIEKRKALKKYIGYVSVELREDDETV